jgi:hypothetical protein
MKLLILLSVLTSSFGLMADSTVNLGNLTLLEVKRDIGFLSSCIDELEIENIEELDEYDQNNIDNMSDEDFQTEYESSKEAYIARNNMIEFAYCNIRLSTPVTASGNPLFHEVMSEEFGSKVKILQNKKCTVKMEIGQKTATPDPDFWDMETFNDAKSVTIQFYDTDSYRDYNGEFSGEEDDTTLLTKEEMATCALGLLRDLDQSTGGVMTTNKIALDTEASNDNNVNDNETDEDIERSIAEAARRYGSSTTRE